jgi:hypothetical protein
MHAVDTALAAMDDVEVTVTGIGSIPREPYDVLLTWNGLHAGRDRLVPSLREKGVPVVIVERGFFDRMNFSQIDHRGFNHTASWAHKFMGGPPDGSKGRLKRITGGPPSSMRPRSDGYVLVLAQKENDTQLWDGPYRTMSPFVRCLDAAVPPGLDIRVRAHPVDPYRGPCAGRIKMIDGTLRDALDGARFAVTINSNAGNEAIRWGCPVLCVGPSVYGHCGAAAYYEPDSLEDGMKLMLAGWTPGVLHAGDYCAWLSTHQYSCAELAAGMPVLRALRAAVPA